MVLPLLILVGGTVASLAMQAYSTYDQVSKPTINIAQPKPKFSQISQFMPFIVIAIVAILVLGVLR